jgi:rhodanese-related sulfurtransferase
VEGETKEKLGIEDARRQIAGGEADAVDIRDEEDWQAGHVPGAIHIPKNELESRTDDLDSDRRLIIFAPDEESGREAVSTLRERGFDAAMAEGGISEWSSEDFRIQPSEDADKEVDPSSD